ncbi:sodium/potassium/calcium exchanger 4 isoform X2 [Diabrotica virgifera virgifera]|uniref:Sodium/potassium/calcium exchanger 4-like isoform X2 n=1 Tax=Diabrotica virgifera virgifera TaxID=50390 RepID=A0A6P7FGA6_DIAVI|nr:sodium/potassium/calcium exchanger 4 isoform X2 [Diabrotica virgifera virgifera]
MSSVKFLCLVFLAVACSSCCAEPTPSQSTASFKFENKYIDASSVTNTRHKRRIFFIPFAKPLKGNGTDNATSACKADDGDDFPYFMSEKTVLHGGVVVVILIGIYGFSLLAVVCNNYFLPCVETICERLNLTPDVAAATFMSIATSTPEFFTNVIGTFVTESDLGIGTIVGSSLFNALGVPAIGGLCSPFPLKLDWFPLTRDCIIYLISVTVLIVITWDGKIFWYETLIPLTVYITYFVIMFNNKRIAKFVKSKIRRNTVKINSEIPPATESANGDIRKLSEISEKKLSSKKHSVDEHDAPKHSIMSAYGTYMEGVDNPAFETEHQKVLEAIQEEAKKEAKKSIFRIPTGNAFKQALFYYTWPIKLILQYTVPNPQTHPNLYPVTFIMCIVWIGVNSYVVSWMISIIGTITKLPDALLGMTLMAIGGCLPETVSMTIIARRGEGAFGVSNSLGANTMNVLYSLGLPWLLKSITMGLTTKHPVLIQSGSIEYTIMSLIFAVCTLYIVLLVSKFRLSKLSGSILGVFYVSLVVLAIVSQTVLFKQQC